MVEIRFIVRVYKHFLFVGGQTIHVEIEMGQTSKEELSTKTTAKQQADNRSEDNGSMRNRQTDCRNANVMWSTYFMPICVFVRAFCESPETPSVYKSDERIVIAILEKLWHDLLHKPVSVMNFPASTVRHPTYDMLHLRN